MYSDSFLYFSSIPAQPSLEYKPYERLSIKIKEIKKRNFLGKVNLQKN